MQLNAPEVDPAIVHQLFLAAFHTEYELVQAKLASGEMSTAVADDLQEQIIYDEMSYCRIARHF